MKAWYKSKTIWLNIVTIVAGTLAGAETYLPLLAPVVGAVAMPWILFLVGVLGVIARLVTTSPILKEKEDV